MLKRRKFVTLLLIAAMVFSSIPSFPFSPNIPTPAYAATTGARIYVLGGNDASNLLSTVEMYNPETNSWTTMPPLSEPRGSASSVTLNNIIYVISGKNKTGGTATTDVTSTILAYNTDDGSSTIIGRINTARYRAGSALLNNKIYVIGGTTTSGKPGSNALYSIEEYDLDTNVSINKADLPASRDLPAVAQVGGKIYIMGGYDSSGKATNDCWEYDPASNTFVSKSPMQTAAAGKATVLNGKIYVVTAISQIQEYDPATDTWKSLGFLPTTRSGPAVEAVNGYLYVVGGDENIPPLTYYNINEAANLESTPLVWETKTPMPTARTRVVSGVVIHDNQPPTAPANLTATAISSTQVSLTWDASVDNVSVAGYRIERSTDGANFTEIGTSTTNSYQDNSTTSAITYYYRVRAYDAFENLSGYSNIANVTTPDEQAPTVPTGLSATVNSANEINLSWAISTDNVGVIGYKIERSTDEADFVEIGSSVTPSYKDLTVLPGHAYYYRVRAYDAAGNMSGYSNAISVATPSGTRFEEPSTSIVYTGTWSLASSQNASGSAYKYSTDYTKPATATFTFTGNSVTWYSAVAPNCGIAKVYLDGVFDREVDLYSPTIKFQSPVYVKENLPYGTHTVKVEVTSKKNASSTGNIVVVDCFEVNLK
ncbi:MAG: fibronectin type III domain-containing protein [Firmicutes bacterium]|nr:fibronectin type III domain-containing protein [Bacillota bacterium]